MIVGLERLYYAKITKDDADGLTFGTPIYLPGVKEIKISPKSSTEKLYAENKLWDQDTALDSIEASINTADLSNAAEADLTGHTVAAEGGIVANADDVAPYVALLYKANKTNGRARYGILYKGKFELPDDSAKTKEGKTDFQTPTLAATFQPLQNNGNWKYQVDSDDPSCPVDIDTTFFSSVTMPTADTAVPTVTTSPADAATGVAVDSNITFTFSKALDSNTVNSGNVLVFKGSDGTLVAGAVSLDATSKIITFNPDSNLSASTAYIAVATTGIKTVAGISAAANTVVNFTTA